MSRAQLLRLAMTPDEVTWRRRAGRLTPVHRGVYAVGHPALTDDARMRVALLAAGPNAVASHGTAAAIWALMPALPAVQHGRTRGDRRRRPSLVVHHAEDRVETRWRRGLVVTSPPRTLADLGQPERPAREAVARGRVWPEDLPDGGPALTRSALERRLLALLRDAGLPQPWVNHRIGPYEADFAWPALGLIVETDGWATHGRRAAFEQDRARDAHLAAAGHTVVRFPWRQIDREPLRVVARIAQAAAARTERARMACAEEPTTVGTNDRKPADAEAVRIAGASEPRRRALQLPGRPGAEN